MHYSSVLKDKKYPAFVSVDDYSTSQHNRDEHFEGTHYNISGWEKGKLLISKLSHSKYGAEVGGLCTQDVRGRYEVGLWKEMSKGASQLKNNSFFCGRRWELSPVLGGYLVQ